MGGAPPPPPPTRPAGAAPIGFSPPPPSPEGKEHGGSAAERWGRPPVRCGAGRAAAAPSPPGAAQRTARPPHGTVRRGTEGGYRARGED